MGASTKSFETQEATNKKQGLNDSDAADLRILLALRRIMRGVDLYSRKLRAQHSITGPQLVCLLAVAKEGPMTVSALGRSVHLSASTIVGILDRLEAKGFVHRERDKQDRRQVYVSATDAGRAAAKSSPSPLQDKLAEALRDLPEQDQKAISESLERIVDLMGVRDLDASPILDTE